MNCKIHSIRMRDRRGKSLISIIEILRIYEKNSMNWLSVMSFFYALEYIKKELSKELRSLIRSNTKNLLKKRISPSEALVELKKIFPCLSLAKTI